MMKKEIAEYINILGRFCGKRDVEALTNAFEKLKQVYGGSIREANPMYASFYEEKM